MDESILLVEDDDSIRDLLKEELECNNYTVDEAPDFKTAFEKIEKKDYSIFILDLKLPDGNGLKLFDFFSEKLQNKTIIITANATIPNAVEAIKIGAYNYIEKPFDESILHFQIQKIIEFNSIKQKNKFFKHEITSDFSFEDIIYKSKIMEELIYKAKILAKTDNIILIEGETGVGKEIFSHSIHNSSNRYNEIFLPVNCAAIPDDLGESELFGYEKGAFTGAVDNYSGKFLQADKGTIFFDEIGDLPVHLQAKLLRVIDDNIIYQLKSEKPKKVDVRIIAATNVDLERKSRLKSFRKDLLYRLRESILFIPPLRERKEDIMPLFYHYLDIFNSLYKKNVTEVTKRAEEYLINYKWEGNIRELKNLLKNTIPFKKDNCFDIGDIISPINKHSRAGRKKILTLIEYERNYINKMYILTGFNKKKTSEILGISIPTLYKYIKN